MTGHVKTIDDPRAPERLRGRQVRSYLDKVSHKLAFTTDVPDDMTAQKQGYLEGYIGEFVDHLKTKVPGVIGDKTVTVLPK